MGLAPGTSHVYRGRAPLVAAVCVLSLLAWIALWRFNSSPYLHHHHGDAPALFGLTFFWFFVLGWTVMAVAMMLPSSVPFFVRFHEVVADRIDRTILVTAVIVGYLAAWVVFGAIVYVGRAAIAQLLGTLPAVLSNQWVIGGVTLAAAGAFQFTSLKHKCLDICKSPSSFIAQHWNRGGRAWNALRLGTLHGAFCVGCCWALMLLMFLVSVGSIAWMLLLAAVMTAEKGARGGRRLSTAIGVVLLATGTSMLALGIGSSL